MRRLVLFFFTALVVLTCLSLSKAQAQTRIRFARGATSKVISGTLNGFRDKRVFLIRVRRGQTLRTAQAKRRGTHYITVYIRSPFGEDVGDSDASCNNRREISPTVAGDYRMEVVECQKADRWRGRFYLRVSVR